MQNLYVVNDETAKKNLKELEEKYDLARCYKSKEEEIFKADGIIVSVKKKYIMIALLTKELEKEADIIRKILENT